MIEQGPRVTDYDRERFIGAIEARTTMLEKRMDVVERDIKAQLGEIYTTLQTLRTAVDSSRGGWRAMAWVAGLLTGIAALYTILHQAGALH